MRVPALTADWDRKWAATNGEDRTVKIWDLNTGALIRTFHGHTQPAIRMVFRPGTAELLAVADDHVLRVWDAATDPDATRFRVPDLGLGVDLGMTTVSGVWAASSDLSRVVVVDAVGDADHIVTVWDTALGRPVGPGVRILSGHLSFAFTSDNRTLLVAGMQGERGEVIRRIDPTTGKFIGADVSLDELSGSGSVILHRDGTRALAWAFHPLPVADPSTERHVELGVLDAGTGKLLHNLPVTGVEAYPRFSTDGKAILFRSKEGGRAFSAETGAELWAGVRLPGGLNWRTGEADLPAIGPGERAAIVRDKSGAYNAIVDPNTGALLARLEVSRHTRGAPEFSPDGRLVAQWVDPSWMSAVAPEDPHRVPVQTGAGIRVWDVNSGRLVLTLSVTGEVQLLQFSADGRKLLSATRSLDTKARKRIAHVQIFDATPRK
jgi:hypothetical protein